MANAIRGNKILIDSAGSVTTDISTKVAYVILTPSASNQAVTFKETATDADDVLAFQTGTDRASLLFDFSRKPIVFNNGIYSSAISSGLKVMLITTTAGG